LRNTPHSGKIVSTRPLALWLFAYSQHAKGRLLFQVLLPFSPVSGVVPSRHLYLTFGGFAAKQTGYWDWLGFGMEQVADNALFDFLSIYGWHISTIHAIGFWSRTVVFLFNIELEALIIAAIVLQFKRLDLLRFVRNRAAGSTGGMSQKRFSNAIIGILNAMIGVFVGGGFIGLIIDIVLAARGHSPAWWIWTITIGAIPVGGIFVGLRDDFEKKMKQEL
jgi:hypothetical protein